MKKLRVGIIGMGGFGITEAEAVNLLPNAQFVAGVRRTPEAAKELSARFGVPIYTDWMEMLEKHEFDLVAITATNDTHRYMTEELIRRGIPVHCQKPMGITLEDARVMRDQANASGVYMQIGFELRYSQLYARTKEIIDSGEIGDVVQMYFNYTPGPWTLDSAWKVKATSGGLFGNKLNHYVDQIRWLIGKPLKSVSCTCAPKIIPYYEFTDNCFSTYFFEGGATAHILFNQTSNALPYNCASAEECYRAGHRLEYNVVGTKGNLFVDIWHPSVRVVHNYLDNGDYYPRLARLEDYRDLPTWKLYHNVQDEVRDIVNRVASGKKEYITPDDAYLSTLACHAADLSMERNGLPITMEEVEAISPAPLA